MSGKVLILRLIAILKAVLREEGRKTKGKKYKSLLHQATFTLYELLMVRPKFMEFKRIKENSLTFFSTLKAMNYQCDLFSIHLNPGLSQNLTHQKQGGRYLLVGQELTEAISPYFHNSLTSRRRGPSSSKCQRQLTLPKCIHCTLEPKPQAFIVQKSMLSMILIVGIHRRKEGDSEQVPKEG